MSTPWVVMDGWQYVSAPGWDWTKGAPPLERVTRWPEEATPSVGLRARIEHLVGWTRRFTEQYRGIDLHSLTILGPGDPPEIEVLLLRDDIDGADDEDKAAKAAAAALRREMPAIAAGVGFRGDYCK